MGGGWREERPSGRITGEGRRRGRRMVGGLKEQKVETERGNKEETEGLIEG